MIKLLRRHALSSLAIVFLTTGCATERVDESWSYVVTLTSVDPPRIAVEARFAGDDPAYRAFATPEEKGMPYIRDLRIDSGGSLIPTGSATTPTTFALSDPARYTSLQYTLDLDELATDQHDLRIASHTGSSVFAAWTSWLLIPDGKRNATVDFSLQTPIPGGDIALALQASDDGRIRARSEDLRKRIYAVFGRLDVTQRTVPRPGKGSPTHVTVASPEGAFRLPHSSLNAWVEQNALLVGDFAGTFPVDTPLVVLVPVAGDNGPVYGRVQPSPAPTLLAFIGDDSSSSDLEEDWILVHELLHMTFPPVSRKDRWIDEGIATYFEPILRYRAGRISEGTMWAELAKGLPRGLRALEERGLENGRGISDVYWGGALFCLLADVEIRRRTHGARGLEDGVRALGRAGYSVTGPMRPIKQLFPVMDQAIGEDVLGELWHRYVVDTNEAPLEELLSKLGVDLTGGRVRLRDDAPLSAVRRALSRGNTAGTELHATVGP